MSDNIAGRIRAMMDAEFLPPSDQAGTGGTERQLVRAAEYTAHHAGRISRTLEKILAVLEKQSGAK